MPRPRRFFWTGMLMLAASVLLFALLEGLASVALLAGGILRTSRVMMAERKHTKYDPEIGWVSAPGLRIPDLYAPGIGLSSNSLGFRGVAETAPEKPPGKLRILCSGDSFTHGYAVKDEDAWCAQLAALDPRIDAVNLGMGGYGIDQMYLWYRRNAANARHDLHVLAVTNADFERVRSAEFAGYAKPFLELRDGVLKVSNRPVPRASWLAPYLLQLGQSAAKLRAVELAGALRLSGSGPRKAPESNTRRILEAVLDDLTRIARERSAGLLLVYIPSDSECQPGGFRSPWREFWRDQGARRRLMVRDLTPDCRALGEEARRLYIRDASRYHVAGALGHQNEHGHRFVAELLLPEVQSALNIKPGNR